MTFFIRNLTNQFNFKAIPKHLFDFFSNRVIHFQGHFGVDERCCLEGILHDLHDETIFLRQKDMLKPQFEIEKCGFFATMTSSLQFSALKKRLAHKKVPCHSFDEGKETPN